MKKKCNITSFFRIRGAEWKLMVIDSDALYRKVMNGLVLYMYHTYSEEQV